MTLHNNGRGNADRPLQAVRSLPGHRPRTARVGTPALTLVQGRAPSRTPVALSGFARSPMPAGVRGAIVTSVDKGPGRTFQVAWSSFAAPARIPPGRIRLSWAPASEGLMDVEARLGLPGAEVLLARWPGLRGDWPDIVRPTVAEVMELHSALRLATVVLNRLTD
ncbi:hypothetical protein GCM10010330_76340 [Streptomyces tendae]|uniref:hypothetical protein n=1 Tax=Streptomyces tendae TaxID=1932 RepID=UPI00198AE7CC|nr:hypothetical protein [Streptomyces tendae]GHB11111.1 hypothetical protein GCM10010330_76340 [Streptomyces tendae]